MSDLAAFFAAWSRFAAEPREGELEAAFPGWSAPPGRLAVYRRALRRHVTETLERLYPACREALAPDAWERLADAYYATRPARTFELNRLGEAWPTFAAASPGAPPFLGDLARFEWTLFEVGTTEARHAPVARLSVNPTLVCLELRWRVCALHAAVARGGRSRPPTGVPDARDAPDAAHAEPVAGDEVALVWRDPASLLARYLAATPRALLALKLAAEGIEPARAAAEGGVSVADVEAVVAEHVATGLVLAPS